MKRPRFDCPNCGERVEELFIVDAVVKNPDHPMVCPVMCARCVKKAGNVG